MAERMTEQEGLREEVDRLRCELANSEHERLKLFESELFYRTLVDLAADTILTGDPTGSILGANQSAVSLTGYQRYELVGQNIALLFSETVRRETPLRYDLLKLGKVIQTERILTRKDGSTVPVCMNSRMMPDGTYHTLIRDITPQKQLEERLKASNRELEAFVYTVSHDLRTPLIPILGFPELLIERYAHVFDAQAVSLLRSIEKAGTGMLAMIEDLLQLASIGALPRPQEPVPTQQVIDEVITALRDDLQRSGVEVRVAPLPPVYVPASFLGQLFNNLIVNALRHAGADNNLIDIGVQDHAGLVGFFVRDYGVGVAHGEREALFELFRRGQAATQNGSGIGLAIVRKLCRSYGGDAWFEETPGGGATVRVVLGGVSG